MKTRNRILSLLLTLVLLLGAVPMTAGAEGENPFADVTQNDYFYDAVLWAYDTGVTVGVDATHFGPQNTVTRAQAVTFLWRAVGEPEPRSAANPFADVKETDWFFKPVLWAVEQGITVGTDAAHFSPAQTCSTMHIVTFLYRALGVGDNGWGQEGADWAEAEGLLADTGLAVAAGTDCPRCAVVTFLFRTVGEGDTGFPANLEELDEDAEPAQKSTTVTEDDLCALSADRIDVTAGEITELHFELLSTLVVDSFSLYLDGAATDVSLTDPDLDGIYTGSYALLRYGTAEVRFTAKTTVGGKSQVSNEVPVTVTEALSAAEAQKLDEVLDGVAGALAGAAAGQDEGASPDERAEQLTQAVLRYLQGQAGYWAEELLPGDTVPTNVWHPGAVEDVLRGSAETGDLYSVSYTLNGILMNVDCSAGTLPDAEIGGLPAAGAGAGAENLDKAAMESWFVTNRERAVVLSFYDKSRTDLEQLRSAEDCVAALEELGFSVDERFGFTVEDFRSLERYAVIVLRSNGSVVQLSGAGELPVICTLQKVTDANRKTYAADLKHKRLAIQTRADPDTGESCEFYSICPVFFTHYYKNAGKRLTARLIHLGMGRGMMNDTLTDALLGSGALCVTGFDKAVSIDYSSSIVAAMLRALGTGKSIGGAVSEAVSKCGKSDPKNDRAVFGYRGFWILHLHDTLENGAFDHCDIINKISYFHPKYAWNWYGAAKPTPMSYGYKAGSGTVAWLSTGKGAYADETTSLIYQPILIPGDATELSARFRLFTEEYSRPRGPKADSFCLELRSMDGKVLKTIAQSSVKSGGKGNYSTTFSFSDAGRPMLATKWYQGKSDISAYRGKVVLLVVWVCDSGDNQYDSAAALDWVKIS